MSKESNLSASMALMSDGPLHSLVATHHLDLQVSSCSSTFFMTTITVRQGPGLMVFGVVTDALTAHLFMCTRLGR
eukprot:scaffold145640_cov17-Tisochrysis_lutea.AAC.1